MKIPGVNEGIVRRYGVSRGSVRDLIIKYVRKREGGELYSPTLREIFRVHHEVDIGMYTMVGCFRPLLLRAEHHDRPVHVGGGHGIRRHRQPSDGLQVDARLLLQSRSIPIWG